MTGGTNYKVGDSLNIDNTGTGGYNADIKVAKVGGKEVSSISCVTSSITGLEVLPLGKSGKLFFHCKFSAHNLLNKEIVSIAGLSTTAVKLTGQYSKNLSTANLVLRAGVGTTGATGIVTYFSAYGVGLDAIAENDVFDIGSEKVKVLNIDRISSRVRVQREVSGTTGAAYTASTILEKILEDSQQTLVSILTFDFRLNRELYFNPVDTVDIGTQSGVGIGTTIVFSNPGSGVTNVFLPTQTLYFPAHDLQTGDELIYNLNGGSALGVSTNGISTAVTLANQSRVYVARIT